MRKAFDMTIAIALKEAKHIVRDPFSMALNFVLPVVLVLIFGFAVDFDVKNISIAVDDRDKSFSSRELIRVFENSGSFIMSSVAPLANYESWIRNEKYKGVLFIAPGFEREIKLGKPAKAQLLLDGADNTSIVPVLRYMEGLQKSFLAKINVDTSPPVMLKSKFLFNSSLNTHHFVVPGLIVIVLAIIAIMQTALAISREWDTGTMEFLLATPASPLEIILGKILPYCLLGLAGSFGVYLLARIVFEVPFRGSHILFVLGTVIFLISCLAQGMLISIMSRKQTLAIQMGIITGLLPGILLSGLFFPIESMSLFFRIFTMILPHRWFVFICRSLFLKDASIVSLGVPFLMLFLLSFIMIGLCVLKFKKDVEA
jgi:ABC-2 type transport system permease protein